MISALFPCWPLGCMVRVGFVGRLTGVFLCVFIARRVLVTRGEEDGTFVTVMHACLPYTSSICIVKVKK